MGCTQSTRWDDTYFQHLPYEERLNEIAAIGARFQADEHLGTLSPYALNKILSFKKAAKLQKNERIVSFGKIPTHLYYVYSSNQYGLVSQKSTKNLPKVKKNVEDVIFDADDFIMQRKSLRTVKVMKNSFVFRISYKDYDGVIKEIQKKITSPLFTFVSGLNFMAGNTEGDRLNFYDLLEVSHHKHNDTIMKVGDDGEYVYWIFEGQVRVYPKDDPTPLLLKAPSHFGELALLSREKRNASIYSDGPATTLIKLHQSHFCEMSQAAIDIFLNMKLDRHLHKKQEEKLMMLSKGGENFEEIDIFDGESMQNNRRSSFNFKERLSLSKKLQDLEKSGNRVAIQSHKEGNVDQNEETNSCLHQKSLIQNLLTCAIEKTLCDPVVVLNNFRFQNSRIT